MPTLDAILETMEHLPVPPVPIIPWPFVPRGGQRHAIFEHPERDRVLAATMSGCGVATLAYNNTEGERDILATIADEKAFYTSLTICPGANLPADRSKWKSQYAEELDSLRTLLDDVCEDVGSLQFVVCNFENQRGLDGGLDVKAFTRYLYDVEYACKQIWPQCVVVWYGSPLPTLFPSEFLTDLLCPSLYYQGNLPLNREAWSEYRGMGIMRACNKFVPFVSVCSGWPSKGAPFAATPGETGSGFAIASMLRGIRDDNVHCLRAVAPVSGVRVQRRRQILGPAGGLPTVAEQFSGRVLRGPVAELCRHGWRR